MTPEKLRRKTGNAPFSINTPDEVRGFLARLSEREPGDLGRYAYQVVQEMTDDELMARWARYQLEKEE